MSLRLPSDVLDAIDEIAEASERTRTWIVVRALRQYLAGEGATILSVAKDNDGARGSYDLDDVRRELAKLMPDAAEN